MTTVGRKILNFLLAAFLIFYIISAPNEAAALIGGAFTALASFFTAIIEFFRSI